MYTWMLFVDVFLGWGASDNAIFMRDAGRHPVWHNIVRQMARFRLVWLLIALFWVIVSLLLSKNLLLIFVLPVAAFALALALTLGPIVVEERTKLSWEPLLTTPYDMKAILLGKASGALWHIRSLTYAMVVLLMCVSAGVGTISLTLIPARIGRLNGWHEIGICGVLVIIPVLGSLLYIGDRMQQFALMAVAALASGTATRSVRAALSTSATVVLLLWFFEIAVAEVFLTLEQGGTWQPSFTSILSLATLGPIVSYVSQMDFSHAAIFIIGTLILRELVIGGLWQWTLRRAQI